MDSPLVMIASVSTADGLSLERTFRSDGWELHQVRSAKDAARKLDGNGSNGHRPVLVIDAGLLQMTDDQWRDLRTQRPDLGTVVLSLIRHPQAPHPISARTYEVHPQDLHGMREAVRRLGR